jgi:hypothetical protein
MREHLRRDGSVVLTGDEGDHDQIIVEGIITAFAPNRNGSRCVCGAGDEANEEAILDPSKTKRFWK